MGNKIVRLKDLKGGYVYPQVKSKSIVDMDTVPTSGSSRAVTSGGVKQYVDKQVADGSVTTSRIADGAVTTPKIADRAVTSDKIVDYAVIGKKIASGAITNDKIRAGAVSAYKLNTDLQSKVNDNVKTVEQTLTAEQKAQARKNIDVDYLTEDEVANLWDTTK